MKFFSNLFCSQPMSVLESMILVNRVLSLGKREYPVNRRISARQAAYGLAVSTNSSTALRSGLVSGRDESRSRLTSSPRLFSINCRVRS